MLGMCINKRVVIGVGLVAVALLALAPRSLVAFAPFLVMAICPLSMLFMVRRMDGRREASEASEAEVPAPAASVGGEVRVLQEEVDRLQAELALRGDSQPA